MRVIAHTIRGRRARAGGSGAEVGGEGSLGGMMGRRRRGGGGGAIILPFQRSIAKWGRMILLWVGRSVGRSVGILFAPECAV